MPRTFFFSPDPKPNRAFEAEFVIEGLDNQKKPLAVVGDKYLMISLVEGSIIFERHLLEIESVDEKANHRAVLKFTSRDGFSAAGAFPLAVEKRDDPTTREEETVTVAAMTPVVETKSAATPITAPTPAATLSIVKPAGLVPLPSTPAAGAGTPIATVASASKAPAVAATPITPPPIPPSAPKQSHPLRLVALIVLASVAILGGMQHFSKKPRAVAAQPKAQPSAPVTNNTPDTVSNTDTINSPEVATPPPETQIIAPPAEQATVAPQAPIAPVKPTLEALTIPRPPQPEVHAPSGAERQWEVNLD
ncbi:MAG: hypothetical protein NTX72_02215 [Candidatus Uhrbacteria bacterium]|nr:hypothetical protein [Candidatus Uhrbacteria bacterium]